MTQSTYAQIKKMSPQFLVTNLDRAITFYTSKLGFDLAFHYEDFYAGIIKDGCSIHLKRGKPSTEERQNKRENNDLDIVFAVVDVDSFYEQLAKSEANYSDDGLFRL